MPIILREGPYRFFFYSGDRDEPQHVHVARDNRGGEVLVGPRKNAEERRAETVGDTPNTAHNRREPQVAYGGVG